MKSVKEISIGFPLKEIGETNCEVCGSVYKLYETKRGVLGACKPCSDRAAIDFFKLPSLEDLENDKLKNFIQNFEKITSDLERATVNSYKPKTETQLKAKQLIVQYIKKFDTNTKQSIVFSGDPGIGKSHLAYATVKAIRGKGLNALFIKSTHLLDQIRQTFNNPHSPITEKQIFDMIEKLDLLVIDDFGSEYIKGNDEGNETWASDVLYKIFDMRMEKANICTTNYSQSDLEKKYGNNGPRIVSRMLNLSTCLRLEGEDFRRREMF